MSTLRLPDLNAWACLRPELRPRGSACLLEVPLCGTKAGVDPERRFLTPPQKMVLAFDPSPSIELGALSLSKGSGRGCAVEWVNPNFGF